LNIPIHYDRQHDFLVAWDRIIPCTCDVRNLENGRRKRNEIVYSIPHHKPYSPDIFPEGLWQLGKPRVRTDCYRAPFFIPTNAARMTRVWEVKNGLYVRATDELTLDEDFGFHASASPTTLGCGRIGEVGDIYEAEDVRWLVRKIQAAILTETLYVEVV
jgi:hypothetical protein